jgi:hypothetical protein
MNGLTGKLRQDEGKEVCFHALTIHKLFRLCKKYFTKGIDEVKNIFTMNTSTNETQGGRNYDTNELSTP